MPRRGRRAGADAPKRTRGPGPLNVPFRGLRSRLDTTNDSRSAPPRSEPPGPAAFPDVAGIGDEALFRRAMEGVDRLAAAARDRVAVPPPALEPRTPVSEDAEALASLSDLVRGDAAFDISETREYVEGHVVGLDPRLLRRLRGGDFSWQTHLDLHGMTAAQARDEVERFIVGAVRDGHRCVLVVHGRGRNSKDQVPVLKEHMKSWLSRGRIGRHVLAFASARSHDGGAGALYVLLRRDRRARPIRVTEGAKR